MATTTAHFRPGMRSARLEYHGLTPLLMHNDTLLDPFHPLTQEMRALTARKSSGRTADEEMQIAKIDWLAGLYLDDELGPYLPGASLKAGLREASKRWKKGETIRRSLVVLETKVPVEYEGPRDVDGLWEGAYRYTCSVKNSGMNGGRVPRTRPCFEEWAVTFTVAFDPKELDIAHVQLAAKRAEWLGLADGRPEFGTFRSEVTDLGGSELEEEAA